MACVEAFPTLYIIADSKEAMWWGGGGGGGGGVLLRKENSPNRLEECEQE